MAVVAFRQDQRQTVPFGNPVIDVEETADVPRGPCPESGFPGTTNRAAWQKLLACGFGTDCTKGGMLDLRKDGHWELLHTRTASTADSGRQSAYEERDRLHNDQNE